METSLTASFTPAHPFVAALSTATLAIEIVIVVVVVALLVAILVINQRRKRPSTAGGQAPPAQSYYADLQQPEPTGAAGAQQPGFAPFGPAGQPDPFAGFAAAPAAPVAPAAPAPPPPPGTPPPGTPAGWLPDPGGLANTLRYWDGSTWTQHVAQRS